jgi:hypothetical protein
LLWLFPLLFLFPSPVLFLFLVLFPVLFLFPFPFLFPYRERMFIICWVINRSVCPHNSVDGLVCDRIALKVRQDNVVEFVNVLLDR